MIQKRSKFILSITASLAVGIIAWVMFAPGANQASAENDRVTATTVIDNSGQQDVSEEQVDALSDGHISDTEMEAALERMAECVENAGFETEPVVFTPPFGWHLEIAAETASKADMASETMDECLKTQAAAVEEAYRVQHRLNADELDRFESLIRACLTDNGVELMPGRSLASSVPMSAADQFDQCKAIAYEQIR